MNPDLSPLAEHVARLDGRRPARLTEVHERIAVARTRRRRSALGAAAASAVVVATIIAMTTIATDQRTAGPVQDPDVATTRPLTYAVGNTIHYGERTIDVDEEVQFLTVTDEGVAFVSEPFGAQPSDDKPLWFTDGSTVKRIGTTSGSPARGYTVRAGDTGPFLVVPGEGEESGSHIVIDTRTGFLTHRERSTYGNRSVVVLGVDGDAVDFVPTADTPCQLIGATGCLRYQRVLRYSPERDEHTGLPWAQYEQDLRSRPRTILGPYLGDPPVPGTFPVDLVGHGPAWEGRGLVLERQGTDLVALGGEQREVTLTVAHTGEPLRLSVPAGATNATRFEFSQWLDDDRIVLFAYTDPSLAEGTEVADEGDIFVCALSTGTCRLELRGQPGTTYQLPGLD